MSKFRVGQRVRIKWSNGWPELGGEEGTIIKQSVFSGGPYSGAACWAVAPDVWGSYHAPRRGIYGGNCCGFVDAQLEPATDCYDKTEWDACVWKPEHLRVDA